MLLKLSDRAAYFSDLTLPMAMLEAAIAQAQSEAEHAAMRSLELQAYEQIAEYPDCGLIPLSMYPISRKHPITVHAGYIRSQITELIDPTDYSVSDGGILDLSRSPFWGWVKINYWSGIDPMNSDKTTMAVKAAIAAILRFNQAS